MASVRKIGFRRDPVRQLQPGRMTGRNVPKPSLIFILLDDIGIEYLDYHGLGEKYAAGTILRESPDPGIEWSYFTTPRLSSLASRGIYFDNFFATSLCSTTRVRVHTGMRLDELGVGNNLRNPSDAPSATTSPDYGFTLDSGILFLAEHLRAQDPSIETAHFGKWHMTDPWSTTNDGGSSHAPDINLTDPAKFGFQTANWGPLPYGGRYAWWNIVDGVPTWIDGESISTFTEQYHAGSVMVNAACDWISTRTNPFFCSISTEFTHMPLDVPPFTLLSSATQTYLTGLGLSPGDRLAGLPQFEDPRIDDNFWPQLYANAEAMDTMVGRVEDSIPAILKPRTYIVVVGDNGGHVAITPENFPSHGKDSLTRGGTNVTCVVYGPRVSRPGRAVKQVCDIGDIYSTIAELMGHPVESSGVSMMPAIVDTIDRRDTAALKPYSFEQKFSPIGETDPALMVARHRTIVNGNFRYVDDDGTLSFYDLRVDPLEFTNLIEAVAMTAEQAAALAAMQAALDAELPTS